MVFSILQSLNFIMTKTEYEELREQYLKFVNGKEPHSKGFLELCEEVEKEHGTPEMIPYMIGFEAGCWNGISMMFGEKDR